MGETSLPPDSPYILVAERPKVDVNLSTVERIEEILRETYEPMTRYRIHKRLAEMGASTTPARLNRALDYLNRREDIIEGSKGVQWTRSESASLARAKLLGRRLE